VNDMWTHKGRLNRRPYLFRVFAAVAVILIARSLVKEHRAELATPEVWLLIGIALGSAVFVFFQHIQRWHDLNKSGWFSIMNAMPLVNVVVGFYLMFAKRSAGPNQYGEDPLANEPKGA
jgi:uncharacterized membrane protein YhaH (DUF805 family)